MNRVHNRRHAAKQLPAFLRRYPDTLSKHLDIDTFRLPTSTAWERRDFPQWWFPALLDKQNRNPGYQEDVYKRQDPSCDGPRV